MKNKNTVIKGLAILALVIGVASISQEIKPRVRAGVTFGVGTPYGYPYRYYDDGNCGFYDKNGRWHFRRCDGYYYGPGPGIGIGFGIVGGRYGHGYHGGYHGHRGHRHRR